MFPDKLLSDFLLLEFPDEQVKEDSFMDIAGIEIHENSITRIYAYFLNSSKNRNLAAVFLNSLLELISAKTNSAELMEISNHFCVMEKSTDKGKRIDLLISSQTAEGNGEYEDFTSAIIIENKIFSPLHNDLADYYNSTKATSKKGILLTLHPHAIPPESAGEFINITHAEWINQIEVNGIPADLPDNISFYLKDFFMNMKNLTDSHIMNADARFFFEHSENIIRARETYDAAWNYIIKQINIAALKLGWKMYGNAWDWRCIWKEEVKEVYFTIDFEKVISAKPSVTILIEIFEKAVIMETELREMLIRKAVYNNDNLKEEHETNIHYAHLCSVTYPLSVNNLDDFASFLLNKIQTDLMPVYEMIRLAIYSKKNAAD